MLGHADGTSFPCLDGAGADQYPNQSLPARDGDTRVATAGQRGTARVCFVLLTMALTRRTQEKVLSGCHSATLTTEAEPLPA